MTWKSGLRPGHARRVDRLDHPVEGQVLVLERLQRRLPYPREEFAEGGVTAGQIGAQHERVDEEADQVVERVVRTARDGCAERDVVPGAEPVQQARRWRPGTA